MDKFNEDVMKELEALLGDISPEELENLNFEDLDNTIILNDEDGNEVEFEFIDLIDYEGGEYAVLMPKEGENAEEELVILKVEDDGENEVFFDVEDDETLDAVFNIFKEKFEAEFADLLNEEN